MNNADRRQEFERALYRVHVRVAIMAGNIGRYAVLEAVDYPTWRLVDAYYRAASAHAGAGETRRAFHLLCQSRPPLTVLAEERRQTCTTFLTAPARAVYSEALEVLLGAAADYSGDNGVYRSVVEDAEATELDIEYFTAALERLNEAAELCGWLADNENMYLQEEAD